MGLCFGLTAEERERLEKRQHLGRSIRKFHTAVRNVDNTFYDHLLEGEVREIYKLHIDRDPKGTYYIENLSEDYHQALINIKEKVCKMRNPDDIVGIFRQALVETNKMMNKEGLSF